ncbi:DUF2911 domain-containing protein [Chitinophaga defluvii]|uniref:DUF2911 domain-containing protein n=1 Tax=Chitinophaga defluvii TaxID=3163343 RepID=A0ABV2T4Z8_9BACT
MKQMILLLSFLVGASSMVFSQAPKSPAVTAEGKNVKVAYGQPSKRNRVIFGELVPYGQVWRTGANKATEITFAKDGTLGGKPVKAGTYTLFTIPEAKEWTIILNSQLGQFGAFDYDKNKGKNVVEVKAPVKTISGAAVEKFTISVPAGKLVFEWDKTKVEVPAQF